MKNSLTEEEVNEGMFMDEGTGCSGTDFDSALEKFETQENTETEAVCILTRLMAVTVFMMEVFNISTCTGRY